MRIYMFVLRFLWPSQPYGVKSKFTWHFYWAGLVLKAVNQYCAHSFARNWQLPYLNQLKEEKDLVENISWSISTKECCPPGGVKPATSWSSVGRASNWATEVSSIIRKASFLKQVVLVSLEFMAQSTQFRSCWAIFSAKNIRILYIESAKTVNEMTLNELVKLTTLWTTGPWLFMINKHQFDWTKKKKN